MPLCENPSSGSGGRGLSPNGDVGSGGGGLCGDDGSVICVGGNPTIFSLSPAFGIVALAVFIDINGINFRDDCTVTFNGSAATVISRSATVVQIHVPAASVLNIQAYPVVLTNPTPGCGASNSINYTTTIGPL